MSRKVSEMGSVERAVNRDLGKMGRAAKASALGAMALSLGRKIDESDTPGAAAAVAKELRPTLLELAKEFPIVQEADELEQLRAERAGSLGSLRSAGETP